jgi:hypothetical protein
MNLKMAENPGKYRQKQESSSHHLKLSSPLLLSFILALLADSLLSDISSIVNRILPEFIRIALFSTIPGS